MPKISKNKLSAELKNKSLEVLLDRINKIKSLKDVDDFLNHIITDREKEIILRRLSAIILRKRGKKYRDIENLLEISKATISRSKQILSGDGYGRNLGKRIYSQDRPKGKRERKRLLPPYKGAKSII
jgi:uncharacterized protein YerC